MEIKNNITYDSFNVNNPSYTYKQNIKREIPKDTALNSNESCSILISEKNEKIINAKKAHDAFYEACDEFGMLNKSEDSKIGNMSFYYFRLEFRMKVENLQTPSFFSEDAINNPDFLPSIDKMKDFAHKLLEKEPDLFPKEFFDFCDYYKEKLINCGCK